MKVAVCLSGQPRTFKSVCRNIRERFELSGVEVHYYIHCWSDNESYSNGGLQKVQLNKEQLSRDLEQCFCPKKLVVEDRTEALGTKASQWDFQMYSVQKSIQLVNELESYDWVFWTRLDLFLSREDLLESQGKILAAKINYQTICTILEGKDYNSVVRKEDDGVEYFPGYYRNDLKDLSLFTPYGGACCKHWCNYHISASDWFLMGKPTVVYQTLGTLYDGFQWYKQRFPEKYLQSECADVSMELFFPLWLQLLRFMLLELKPEVLFDRHPNTIIFRKVCEDVGVNPETREGLEFVWILQETGDCFEQNYSVDKVRYLWEGWKSRYSTKGLFESRKWLFEARNEYSSTNSSIRKGNKNTDLI